MTAKRSTYDPEKLSIKLGISLEEATTIVEERKRRTAGTEENFIRRHGEALGKLKFEEFKRKSCNNKEKFQKKYGENWEIEWNKYKKSKESRSVEYHKKKYGENWETVRSKTIKSWMNTMTREGMIERYGEEAGIKKYEAMNNKKAHSLQSFINKYGIETGTEKYTKLLLTRDSSSLEFFYEKFGEALGKIKYDEKCIRSSPIYCALKEIYKNEDLALIKYKELKDLKIEFPKSLIKTKFAKLSRSNVSKSSIKIFNLLKELFGIDDMRYGKRKNELRLIDTNTGKWYWYDCFIPAKNLILEYNGSAFHYHESFEDTWCSCFGETKQEIIKRDSAKRAVAENNGYTVIYVWDFETNSQRRLMDTIERLKKVLC